MLTLKTAAAHKSFISAANLEKRPRKDNGISKIELFITLGNYKSEKKGY